MVAFFPSERKLGGANELNQVAVKQSEAIECKVVLFGVVVFSFLLRLGGGGFPRLLLEGGVFPPPLFGWRYFPSKYIK